MSDRYTKLITSEDDDNELRVSGHKRTYYNDNWDGVDISIVEKNVKDWLNRDNPNEIQYYVQPLFYFTKSTICVKSCSNAWDIYNIATSSYWSNIISSDLITNIGDNASMFKTLPNEVRSEIYNHTLFPKRLKRFINRRNKRLLKI